MKKLQKGFSFKRTRFKRLTDLTVHFQNAGVVRLGTNAKGATQIEHVDGSKLEDEEVVVKPVVPVHSTVKNPKISHEPPRTILPGDKKKTKTPRKKAKAADGPSLFGEDNG